MLLTTVIVVLIGVSWVFMFGVMVGRGYNPETKIHEIAGRVLRGRQAPAVQEPPQAILRPEELDFGPALRDKPLHNASAAVGQPAAQPPALRMHSADVSVPPAASAQAAQPSAPPAQPARFDYVYQVAVFCEAGQADRLRERLEGEGVRTTLEQSPARDGKTLHKVLAARRGTEEDEQQLLGVVERLRLGPPMLRSKKPVGGGAR
jgi:cell division septation protein DedD